MLIVTEGTKTEPDYFDEIRVENRVGTAYIMAIPADGTQPLKVVTYAEKKFKETKAFDHVFAVFDRDSHPIDSYQNALAKAAALNGTLKNTEGKPVSFTALPSVPCFEYWLLLHYQNQGAFVERDVIYQRLRGYWPQYAKGVANVYAHTSPNFAAAKERAVAIRRQFAPESGTESYTKIDVLVDLLKTIRRP